MKQATKRSPTAPNRAGVVGMVLLPAAVLVGCGGGGARRSDAGDASRANDGDAETTDAQPLVDEGTAGDLALPDTRLDVNSGDPIRTDELKGSWYSLDAVAPDGGFSDVHNRLRFDGDKYYLVQNTRNTHCVEVGTFAVVGSSLRMTTSYVQGFGPCIEGIERLEVLARTEKGFSLGYRGIVFSYVPIRTNVPKLFVTIETHDGNLMGDALLPGATAVEKADRACNASVAKPDGQTYRALFTDGVNRTAVPAKDWVLRPLTTYFRPDGVVNVFTTSADGLTGFRPHHALVENADRVPATWTGFEGESMVGSTCNGWTSSAALGQGGTFNSGLSFGTVAYCERRDVSFLCVSDATPDNNPGADGGADGGALNASELLLQGTWIGNPVGGAPDGGVSPMLPIGPRRLRMEGKQYWLVWAGGNYCGEIGTFEATATTVRFHPQRIEGFGSCQLDVEREETLAWNGVEFTLSRTPKTVRFVPAPAGARIFATLERHSGDFAGDLSLPGADAIAKADSFCNQSSARPDGKIYKALLVDGTKRSASPPLDWVLKPFTTYYQAIEMTMLFTTNATGLYDQSLAVTPIVPGGGNESAWTGLKYDGTVDSNCLKWTSRLTTESGRLGSLGSSSLSQYFGMCPQRYALFCAGQ